jgi:uncharacterized membrane protein
MNTITDQNLTRFHNGQTINLSILLGFATLFYTWRSAATPALKKEFTRISAFTGSIYWITGMAAILYPGTMGLDPEFGGPGFPQAPLFTINAVCALVGSWLNTPSVTKAKGN